jgi:hypothetical protein
METTTSKTVFIEYSSARQGQHFMTVVQTMNHERVIVGRIYREYNPETKKTYYRAYDFQGNQIFGNGFDITELKNKFKKSGKFMAEMSLAVRKQARQVNSKLPNEHKALRVNDINTIRDKKAGKEKENTKDKEKMKASEKTKLNQMEKEQDDKNHVQYKDLGKVIDAEQGINKSHEVSESNSNPESTNQDGKGDQFQEDEKSEREMELEDIRANNDDREQDIDGPDQDIDL